MPRYIDADALRERLLNCEFETNCVSEENKKEILKILRIFIPQIIANEPTVGIKLVKGWISVKERLPPYGERVLVVNEAYEAKRGYNKYNCGVTVREPHLDFTFWGHKITYWQPLPEPPEGE